jgi:hypothetical protein
MSDLTLSPEVREEIRCALQAYVVDDDWTTVELAIDALESILGGAPAALEFEALRAAWQRDIKDALEGFVVEVGRALNA